MTTQHNAQKEQALREEIVRVGSLLYQKGLIVATDGNISTRLKNNTILITPSGLCKGFMTPDQLIIIDMNGNKIGPGTAANQNLNPTSETPMHLEVYKQRPDVDSVVHAHPPYAISLSIVGISLADCMLPEAIVNLGLTPTTPYSTPASEENARAIREVISGHDAVVLQRHGSLTTGSTPLNAFYRTETLEQIARITFMLNQLGGGQPLPPHQVEKLLAARRELGLGRVADEIEFCEICGVCHLDGQHKSSTKSSGTTPESELVNTITERVLQALKQ